MRGNRQRLHVGRQRERIVDDIVLFAGRDVDARSESEERRHLDRPELALGGLVGKVDADGGLLGLGFAGEMKVHLQDDVGSLRQRERHALR